MCFTLLQCSKKINYFPMYRGAVWLGDTIKKLNSSDEIPYIRGKLIMFYS